ncbi:hypothetical protein LF41_1309 [Lysobacter dokdonensis DS-58]|uniref:Uncharacterized protein n=1 Tax=Lysobacter dokdonensis DS-58 TaxID=1300345 RepID=A0A0A2X6B4_9GAMM|nr:hypothetical protein LF41_1309 [Lysobacter dokdonensis DS-58]
MTKRRAVWCDDWLWVRPLAHSTGPIQWLDGKHLLYLSQFF